MKKPKSKPNLKEEVAAANGQSELITDKMLLDLCPKNISLKMDDFAKRVKAAKTLQQRADLIFQLNNNELKILRQVFNAVDELVGKLEQKFLQDLPENQTGVAGKLGRCERKTKDVPIVEDWAKFYGYVVKNKAFDLMQRRLNDKAVSARWEDKKQIPGVGVMKRPVISVTAVKK